MFNAATSPLIIIHRPRNRNTYITIKAGMEVCVRTPLKNEAQIRQLLKQKEEWIRSRLIDCSQRRQSQHELGKTIRFRGENYSVESFPKLQKQLEKTPEIIDIEKYYIRFYREEAQISLPSRIRHYASKMGLSPAQVRFKKMRRRWGSCDSNGVVTFNILMMQLSYEHIDYIIVHELAHLVHMNHSPSFHQLVRVYLPEEGKIRRDLRRITPL